MAVSDWDRRELCPDGSCTGLIGPEGTCKVCGRAAPNWGDERKRGTQPVDPDDDETEDEDEDEDSADPIAPSTKVEIGGGEWSVRRLCSDGSCIGVIGDDGKCKVCGKAGAVLKRGEPDDEDDVAAEGEGDEEEDEDDEDDTRASDEDEDEDEDEGDEDEDDTRASDDEDDDEEEEEGDEDQADDDLAAAADQLAGVASSAEVAAADRLAGASKREGASKSRPEARADDDDDDRQLCPDGGCIGVIGDNGKCKVCGKEAAA